MTQHMQYVTATVTRPANVTAYTAGDVIADKTSGPTLLTFEGSARDIGHGGTIVSAVMIDSASTGTAPAVDLFLFDTAVTAMEDNAAFDPTDAEMATSIGVYQFPAASVIVGLAGGNTVTSATDKQLGFQCLGSKHLYAVPVERTGYTPISGETFTFRLGILLD